MKIDLIIKNCRIARHDGIVNAGIAVYEGKIVLAPVGFYRRYYLNDKSRCGRRCHHHNRSSERS